MTAEEARWAGLLGRGGRKVKGSRASQGQGHESIAQFKPAPEIEAPWVWKMPLQTRLLPFLFALVGLWLVRNLFSRGVGKA